jgi:hypothetical protein
MDLQHINVKLFFRYPQNVDMKEYLTIFNSWIQRHVSDEMLIDVADYGHVHDGPGVVLVGLDTIYSVDNAAGRLGFLYNRKADVTGTNAERITQALSATLTAALRLQKENKQIFKGDEVQIIVNDRLVAPNTEDTLATFFPDLKAVFDRLYSGTTYELNHNADPRERFTVNVKAAKSLELAKLLANLQAPVAVNS